MTLPADLWASIKGRLEAGSREGVPPPRLATKGRVLARLTWRPLAAAAVITLAVGAALLVWDGPLEAPAEAAQIDFRPLLEQVDGNIEAGIAALINTYGGEAVSLDEAARWMKVRIHAPEELPGGLRWNSLHMLRMGRHHRALASHFKGPTGQLLLLQCPAGVQKQYGNHECLPCRVGPRDGHAVRAGPLRLTHMESANVCVCVVTTLDESTALPAALAAVQIEF